MAISTELGQQHEVSLPQGTITYRERGTGDPIVFVHGALVNADLWRKVVPELAKDFRCIAPDLPLGSHEHAMPGDADLSPPGVAKLIADFLAALDVDNVTLVGNDTGGAICQVLVTQHPDRIGRLVLTNCDAYDVFPPWQFKALFMAGRIPGVIWAIAQPLRIDRVASLPDRVRLADEEGNPAPSRRGRGCDRC